jgi:hypothetical protein
LQDNWSTWNKALLEKDFAKAAAMYAANDVTFVPVDTSTGAAGFLRDKNASDQLLELIQNEKTGTIVDQSVTILGEDTYLHTGLYDCKKVGQTRFSYIWTKVDDVWKMLHHHSSAATPKAGKVTDAEMVPIAEVIHSLPPTLPSRVVSAR